MRMGGVDKTISYTFYNEKIKSSKSSPIKLRGI